MSLVTVQLGQCGNQVGAAFFHSIVQDIGKRSKQKSKVEEDYEYACKDKFFDESKSGQWTARAVLIDMEIKAVAHTIAEAKKFGLWTYRDNNQLCQKKGSGNNWANGFCTHGPKVCKDVLDLIRQEVERCDAFGGFLALLSLAGGTGSGLGAYVCEALREEYPESFILSQVVWPYSTGEVSVQPYNALLTLCHLYSSVDAILNVQNDGIQQICTQRLGIKKVSMNNLNTVIGRQMTSLLQPAWQSTSVLVHLNMGELLQHIVPLQTYKLLNMYTLPYVSSEALPYTTFQWSSLLKHLRQMMVVSAPIDEGLNWQLPTTQYYRSLATQLIVRGLDYAEADSSMFFDPKLYASSPVTSPCLVWRHSHPLLGHEKSACLVSNGQGLAQDLNKVVHRAWTMYGQRAYLHQYTGISDQHWMDCFTSMENIVHAYSNI